MKLSNVSVLVSVAACLAFLASASDVNLNTRWEGRVRHTLQQELVSESSTISGSSEEPCPSTSTSFVPPGPFTARRRSSRKRLSSLVTLSTVPLESQQITNNIASDTKTLLGHYFSRFMESVKPVIFFSNGNLPCQEEKKSDSDLQWSPQTAESVNFKKYFPLCSQHPIRPTYDANTVSDVIALHDVMERKFVEFCMRSPLALPLMHVARDWIACEVPISGDGNCQFRAVALATSHYFTDTMHSNRMPAMCQCPFTFVDMRAAVVDAFLDLDHEESILILQAYALEPHMESLLNFMSQLVFESPCRCFTSQSDRSDFVSSLIAKLNRTQVTLCMKELTKVILKPGFEFEGDHFTLQLLARTLKMDIWVVRIQWKTDSLPQLHAYQVNNEEQSPSKRSMFLLFGGRHYNIFVFRHVSHKSQWYTILPSDIAKRLVSQHGLLQCQVRLLMR